MGAILGNRCYDKELLILGMTEIVDNEIDGQMFEGSCAENIKCAIEKILNENEYQLNQTVIFIEKIVD